MDLIARGRRRWAGPPPLLIAVTILGLAVAPAVSDEGSPGGAPSSAPSSAQARLTSGATTPEPAGTDVGTQTDSGAATQVRPPAPTVRPTRIGVVSMNAFRDLSLDQLRQDAERVTSLPGVDVVGWQEAERSGPVFAGLSRAGWATRTFGGSAAELAVSWRRSTFRFVSVAQRRVARGQGEGDERYRFGDRYVVRVTLRHRDSGQDITVINAHLPQKAEDLDDPGHWTPTRNAEAARKQLDLMADMWGRVPGRWAIATGDFNFGAAADAATRLPRAPFERFQGKAASSYRALGPAGTEPTHPSSGRYIDYVFAGAKAVRADRLRFLGQRTIGGLNSDHRALFVRLRLS